MWSASSMSSSGTRSFLLSIYSTSPSHKQISWFLRPGSNGMLVLVLACLAGSSILIAHRWQLLWVFHPGWHRNDEVDLPGKLRSLPESKHRRIDWLQCEPKKRRLSDSCRVHLLLQRHIHAGYMVAVESMLARVFF